MVTKKSKKTSKTLQLEEISKDLKESSKQKSYKNMDNPILVKDVKEVIHVISTTLKVGDIFTFFDPYKILPSYYEVILEQDLCCKVYKIVNH